MPPEITRRSLLLGAAGLAALSACGNDDKTDVSVPRTSTTAGGAGRLSVVVASAMLVSGIDERVAFGVLEGSPPKPVKGDTEVTVRFAKVGGGAATEAVPADFHDEGVEERPYFSVRHTFSEPGNYVLTVTRGGTKTEAGVPVSSPADMKVPYTGQALPSVASPTTSDARGVNPICTRKPPCPLHDLSIDAALAQKKPLILLISTPALCRSAICGPVLDILLDVKPTWEGKANAVHAEVFTDLTGQASSEVTKAFNLVTEPVFYLVGSDGKIRDRFDGPVDKPELTAAITRLLT